MPPSSRRLSIRGLTHHVLSWAPATGVDPTGLTVLLVHGFADAGGSWDLVAPALASAGHAVLAPDMRGFGETDWIGAGGYYHFPDYVADLDAILAQLAPGRLAVIGHSMGGTIAALLAGARPARVEKLALLEGLGPPDNDPRYAPDRFTRWLDDMASSGRPQKAFRTLDEARVRLAHQHPGVPPERLASRAGYLVKPVDGGFTWRFDPLHRTTSPQPFFASTFLAFASRVTCPVLFVSGGPEGFHPEDEAERIAAFGRVTTKEIAGAGHMMHWTRPEELSAELLRFLALPAGS